MPDLNSVPPSPHVLARRNSSQQMPPPPVPNSPLLNILPSNQQAVSQASNPSPALPSPQILPASVLSSPLSSMDNTGVGPGPGPVRHPRPLTAADLHLELEKEQEAVVNRLSRELSMLRAAHNRSVASNASSTSASTEHSQHIPGAENHPYSSAPGFSHHRATRPGHNRTSSSASSRSVVAAAGSISTTSLAGVSSPAPVRPTPSGGVSLSRENSATSHRSRNASPIPGGHHVGSYSSSHGRDHVSPYLHQATAPTSHPSLSGDPPNYFAIHRNNSLHTPGSTTTNTTVGAVAGSEAGTMSPGILPATSRYEETAFYRAELERAKRENEALKRQIRELEKMVRDRRASSASQTSFQQQGGAALRSRSGSVSTTASVHSVSGGATVSGGGGATIASQRDAAGTAGAAAASRPRVVSMMSSTSGSVGVGVPEEEVRVGESAASAGMAPAGNAPAGSAPAA